jgi:hypothetical protein
MGFWGFGVLGFSRSLSPKTVKSENTEDVSPEKVTN